MDARMNANQTRETNPGRSCYDPCLDQVLFPSEDAATDVAATDQPFYYKERSAYGHSE